MKQNKLVQNFKFEQMWTLRTVKFHSEKMNKLVSTFTENEKMKKSEITRDLTEG